MASDERRNRDVEHCDGDHVCQDRELQASLPVKPAESDGRHPVQDDGSENRVGDVRQVGDVGEAEENGPDENADPLGDLLRLLGSARQSQESQPGEERGCPDSVEEFLPNGLVGHDQKP